MFLRNQDVPLGWSGCPWFKQQALQETLQMYLFSCVACGCFMLFIAFVLGKRACAPQEKAVADLSGIKRCPHAAVSLSRRAQQGRQIGTIFSQIGWLPSRNSFCPSKTTQTLTGCPLAFLFQAPPTRPFPNFASPRPLLRGAERAGPAGHRPQQPQRAAHGPRPLLLRGQQLRGRAGPRAPRWDF